MSDIDDSMALPEAAPARRRLPLWLLILAALPLLAIVGGATWYFFLGGRVYFASAPAKPAPSPLPFFYAMKPFVVTVGSASGTPHFVQLGVSLQLPGSTSSAAIDAVLPNVQDAMRQTVLGFKTDDLETPEGVDKLRTLMQDRVNQVLSRVLGPERIAELNGASAKDGLVQNIYFPTLVVE